MLAESCLIMGHELLDAFHQFLRGIESILCSVVIGNFSQVNFASLQKGG